MPGGDSVTFPLHGQIFTEESASCFVIKDAGDDPDVTNGAEVHAVVNRNFFQSLSFKDPLEPEGGFSVVIEGGTGIGKVTKPGLAVPPGEWAFNPVPRQMITDSVSEVFTLQPSAFSPQPSALSPQSPGCYQYS